jgi:hypothetical protein
MHPRSWSREGRIGVGLGILSIAGLGGYPAGSYLGWFHLSRTQVVAVFIASAMLAALGIGLVVHAFFWPQEHRPFSGKPVRPTPGLSFPVSPTDTPQPLKARIRNVRVRRTVGDGIKSSGPVDVDLDNVEVEDIGGRGMVFENEPPAPEGPKPEPKEPTP